MQVAGLQSAVQHAQRVRTEHTTVQPYAPSTLPCKCLAHLILRLAVQCQKVEPQHLQQPGWQRLASDERDCHVGVLDRCSHVK